MKSLTFIVLALFCINTHAIEVEDEPQAPASLKNHVENAHEVLTISVNVKLGDSPLSGKWNLSQTQMHVLFGKLKRLKHVEHAYDEIFEKIKEPSKRYAGLELSFSSNDDDLTFETLVFYAGKITNKEGKLLFVDPGRLIEYWLWGTAQSRVQQQIGMNVLNIFAFDQCVQLGHLLIETDPRQCLMPNTVVMLDLGEMPTFDALQIKTFEQCLISGTAIIDSFPRRCMAAGGKLYAEPPRMPDGRPMPERSGFTEFQ